MADPAAPFGYREDGTPKGMGFLGLLKRPDGKVSSELSIGVNIDGKETLIPSMVPTLTKSEVSWLLNNEPDPKKIPRAILDKAVQFARGRIKAGKSPFAQPGEAPVNPAPDPPELPVNSLRPFGVAPGFVVHGTLDPKEQEKQDERNLWEGYPATGGGDSPIEAGDWAADKMMTPQTPQGRAAVIAKMYEQMMRQEDNFQGLIDRLVDGLNKQYPGQLSQEPPQPPQPQAPPLSLNEIFQRATKKP